VIKRVFGNSEGVIIMRFLTVFQVNIIIDTYFYCIGDMLKNPLENRSFYGYI